MFSGTNRSKFLKVNYLQVQKGEKMSYNIFEGSADVVQNDGTALVNSEVQIDNGTVKNGGNVAANGPLDAINTVKSVDNYESVMGGKNVGAASWSILSEEATVVSNGTGDWVGFMRLTMDSSNGTRYEGEILQLSAGSGNYSGVYRVLSVTSSTVFIVNGSYVAGETDLTLSKGQRVSSSDFSAKKIGNITPGQYAARVIGLPIWNGLKTVDTLSSGSSDYSRRKVNSRASVRTKKVEASIRAGDWNVFTGSFDNPVAVANDFAGFGGDDEIANNGVSVGGEFSFRDGITVTKKQYQG